ncbi:hypothetical protein RhiirA4_479686 [Rhizophagus irregularis]|uniref:DUF8211 domain-containing protein n=1 Tax=Rhizophagus irregularis TaxID=588596 RepID=A0A2I1HGS8_9GLOM|nr:hypothetical protein RhiirA4_479686 [Rhizophagus irregularis]
MEYFPRADDYVSDYNLDNNTFPDLIPNAIKQNDSLTKDNISLPSSTHLSSSGSSYYHKPLVKSFSSSTSSVRKTPLKVSFSKFHVTRSNRAGYNKIYEIRRSKSYFFELGDLPKDTNEIHLRIYTNDYHMKNTQNSYRNTSTTPNDRYRISCMLTHFFSSQRVLPRKIQQKYFSLIRDKLLARKEMISSRDNSTRERNITTKTFFYFTYKKYRFHFGIYIPCHHEDVSSLPSLPNRICTVPSPFVMSKGRRACVSHQPSFFKNNILHNVRNVQNGKQREHPNAFLNDKSSHANLLFNKWNRREKKQVHSQRLGISYMESLHARNKGAVLQGHNKFMYRKRFDNFQIEQSKNARTAKRQDIRHQRSCRRIFNRKEHNREDTMRHRLITAQRYRFLFLNSQYVNKPIKHLRYSRGLEYPDYGFYTPYGDAYCIRPILTAEPFNPIPDMVIPSKYRGVIPKVPVYTNSGSYIVPGSRQWFRYIDNVLQNPPPRSTRAFRRAQRAADLQNEIQEELRTQTPLQGTSHKRYFCRKNRKDILTKESNNHYDGMSDLMKQYNESDDLERKIAICKEMEIFNQRAGNHTRRIINARTFKLLPLDAASDTSDDTKEIE